jgi:hypothetical protein
VKGDIARWYERKRISYTALVVYGTSMSLAEQQKTTRGWLVAWFFTRPWQDTYMLILAAWHGDRK